MSSPIEEVKKQLLLGDVDSARQACKEILKGEPSNTEALHALSLSYFYEKEYGQAESVVLKALDLRPDDPELLQSLGYILQEKGDFAQAVEVFGKAKQSFASDAKRVKVLQQMAAIHIRTLQLGEAKRAILEILEIQPDHVAALKMLAQIQVGQLQYNLAIETLGRLPVDPGTLELLKVEVYLLKSDIRNALKCAKKAVEVNSEEPRAQSLLGECYFKAYDLENAKKAFQQALDLDSFNCKTLTMYLSLLLNLCEWEGRKPLIERLRRLCAEDRAGSCRSAVQPTIAVLAGFANQEIQWVAEARSRLIEEAAAPVRNSLSFARRSAAGKKVRIGYLSSDFYDHATAHLMGDVFGLHSRNDFEIYAYSYSKKETGYYRTKIMQDCDRFIEIGKISDRAAAERIFDDGIDILVDLKGYIVDHRLGIAALRPAPVQVHYLGYPGTIGASFIDYLIADPYVIPESERQFYTERIAYLPITYQANMAEKRVADVHPSRQDYGLPQEAFVFCCFNQNDKLDPETMAAWMRILTAVPDSVLWLWGNYDKLKEKIDIYGKERGIDPDRFIVSGTEPNPRHLARLTLADLFLDTFFYSAHTSCSDALRMGLPVLTRPGRTFASRVAAGLLENFQAGELIAEDTEDYVTRAVAFAENPGDLKQIKEKIAANRAASGIYDPVLFTGYLEEAYRRMWETHSQGKPPADIVVSR